MTPLRVKARLKRPCVPGDGRLPLMLDACLLAGMGYHMGAQAGGDWIDVTVVAAQPLPLARVTHGDLWWYACSQAIPQGREVSSHIHRRAPTEHYGQYVGKGSVSLVAGPDKSLRKPIYSRPEWLEIDWTCVGDETEVRFLLQHCPGVGKYVPHGYGHVEEWTVTPDDTAPSADAYLTDISLRHIPIEVHSPLYPASCQMTTIPLVAPYYRKDLAVDCWQRTE